MLPLVGAVHYKGLVLTQFFQFVANTLPIYTKTEWKIKKGTTVDSFIIINIIFGWTVVPSPSRNKF